MVLFLFKLSSHKLSHESFTKNNLPWVGRVILHFYRWGGWATRVWAPVFRMQGNVSQANEVKTL